MSKYLISTKCELHSTIKMDRKPDIVHLWPNREAKKKKPFAFHHPTNEQLRTLSTIILNESSLNWVDFVPAIIFNTKKNHFFLYYKTKWGNFYELFYSSFVLFIRLRDYAMYGFFFLFLFCLISTHKQSFLVVLLEY